MPDLLGLHMVCREAEDAFGEITALSDAHEGEVRKMQAQYAQFLASVVEHFFCGGGGWGMKRMRVGEEGGEGRGQFQVIHV
jgi:hypothetical protein